MRFTPVNDKEGLVVAMLMKIPLKSFELKLLLLSNNMINWWASGVYWL
jgi:hypothetical protein